MRLVKFGLGEYNFGMASPTGLKGFFLHIAVFQIGVGYRPLAYKNLKWPILSERPGRNGLSNLENQAQMADHFYGIPATASPCTMYMF